MIDYMASPQPTLETDANPAMVSSLNKGEKTHSGEKEREARKVIQKYMRWSLGAGLIPVPFVDLVAVSGVQLKMLAEISKIYDVDFQESRGKMLIASLLGYLVPNMLSFGSIGSLLKGLPLVGPLVGAPSMVLFCGASTYAVGRIFVQHFESGGTFLTFEPSKVKGFFQKEFGKGRKVVVAMQKDHSPNAPV
jgi:uncharacterized protein (DUF697 family)